jgi:phage-related minor tail protein
VPNNEIKVTVAAKETGLDKIEASAKVAGKSIGDSLEKGAKAGQKAHEDAAKKIDAAFDSAAKGVAADLDRIERQAWESGRGMDREFTRSLQSMRDDLDRVRADAATTGAGLESKIGGALRQIREDAKRTGKELDDALDEVKGGSLKDALGEQVSGGGLDVSGMIESLTGGAGGAWATAGAAIGGMVAEAEVKAFEAYFHQVELGGVIAAQQGDSAAEAGKLGSVAGNAYYQGLADSVEEGGAALSGVLNQKLVDTTDSRAEIQKLTDMAATAAKVVGDDANEIARAASQLLRTGLAKNATEAIDMITYASQQGANRAGDLIDTIEEYSTKFRDLGLNGQESLGLVNQALDAGARNADIAADAIKEFAIRGQDGSAATARGFRALGLDAKTMTEDLASGGKRAHDALDLTLDRLRAIEDPVKRDQAAVDLFGTKAEDLGDSLYSMDLDTASDGMSNFADSTKHAADTIEKTQDPIDRFSRGVEGAFSFLVGGALGMSDGADQVEKKWSKLGDAAKDGSNGIDSAKSSTDQAADSSHAYAQSLQEIVDAQHEVANTFLDQEDASLKWIEAMQTANQAVRDNGKNTDLYTEKGQANRQTLLDMADAAWTNIDAMEANGQAAVDVQNFMGGAREKFVQTAIAMGYGADEANNLADQLRLVPGDYNARVHADTAGALQNLNAIRNAINSIPRNVNIAINQATKAVTGHASGGIASAAELGAVYSSGMPHAADGGAQAAEFFANEQGPELVRHPDGSVVVPHGMSEKLMQGWGGGQVEVVLSFAGNSDPVIRGILQGLRAEAKFRYGGSAQAMIGAAGV